MARARGVDRAQCADRVALRVQRVPAAAGGAARADPGRPRVRLRPGRRGIRRRHDAGAHSLRRRHDPDPGAGLRGRERAGHRPGRDRGRPDPARRRVRRALRHRGRRGLHPRAAAGEPDGDASAGPGERLHREPAAGRRDDRGPGVRLGDPRLWAAPRRRLRRGPGHARLAAVAGPMPAWPRRGDRSVTLGPDERAGRCSGGSRSSSSGASAGLRCSAAQASSPRTAARPARGVRDPVITATIAAARLEAGGGGTGSHSHVAAGAMRRPAGTCRWTLWPGHWCPSSRSPWSGCATA